MKFILIKTNMECEVVEISQDNFLNDCYEHINCSFIEVCVPRGYGNVLRFVIDDCGKINAQEVNLLATLCYNRGDVIFGNVLVGRITYLESGEQDIIGLSDRHCEAMLHHLNELTAQICGSYSYDR